jgi:hypothetical protein
MRRGRPLHSSSVNVVSIHAGSSHRAHTATAPRPSATAGITGRRLFADIGSTRCRHRSDAVPLTAAVGPAVLPFVNLIELQGHELRVPIQRIRAEIHTEREHMTGALLLPPLATIEEVFEEDAAFVPSEVEGQTRLLARSSIAAIVVDDDGMRGSLASLGVTYAMRPVAVYLRNGAVLEGSLVLSPTLRRTLDVLNQSAKSFALHAGERMFHVAKAHVVRVEEVA